LFGLMASKALEIRVMAIRVFGTVKYAKSSLSRFL
jgi:hypothetical protein